jgi:hypothetical protein
MIRFEDRFIIYFIPSNAETSISYPSINAKSIDVFDGRMESSVGSGTSNIFLVRV